MDRLFLRVYAHLLAALLVGVVLIRILVVPRVDERLGRNIEETFSAAVALMAETLADSRAQGRDLGAPLDRARARFRAPVELVPRAEVRLRPVELARLDRGEVLRTGNPFQAILFTRVGETGEVLKIGPVNAVHPWVGLRGAALLVLFVGALSIGVHTVLRPIRRRLAALERTATALGRGDLAARADVGPGDAIGTVAAAFNGMAAEIQRLIARQEELLHMTSHELRTPMQRLHFALEDVRAAAPGAGPAVDRMAGDLGEMDQLIAELLTYVRLDERRPDARSLVGVTDLVRDLCEGLAATAPRVTLVGPTEAAAVELQAEAKLVRRAVSNLVVNALRHAASRVEVAVERAAGSVRIRVDDDGPGIAAADRERVFEPFVRLDQAPEKTGFGLGLAIARRIAEVHGGTVAALSSPLGGARFELRLPARGAL